MSKYDISSDEAKAVRASFVNKPGLDCGAQLDDLVKRLRLAAEAVSKARKAVTEAWYGPDYSWSPPECTIEWEAADAITRLRARVAELERDNDVLHATAADDKRCISELNYFPGTRDKVMTRSPYDGEPYYCVMCGNGYDDYTECQDGCCKLEDDRTAKSRKQRRKPVTSDSQAILKAKDE